MHYFLNVLIFATFVAAVFFFFEDAELGTADQLKREGTWIMLLGISIVFFGLKFLYRHSQMIN